MFGRATITLGIGPRSSCLFFVFVSDEIRRRVCLCVVQFYLVTDLQSTNDKKCLRVQSGDRVGVYFEHDVSALSYHFTTDRSNVRTMAHLFRNASLPVAGSNEDVRFYNIIYPYHFLAAAYCYQGKQ